MYEQSDAKKYESITVELPKPVAAELRAISLETGTSPEKMAERIVRLATLAENLLMSDEDRSSEVRETPSDFVWFVRQILSNLFRYPRARKKDEGDLSVGGNNEISDKVEYLTFELSRYRLGRLRLLAEKHGLSEGDEATRMISSGIISLRSEPNDGPSKQEEREEEIKQIWKQIFSAIFSKKKRRVS